MPEDCRVVIITGIDRPHASISAKTAGEKGLADWRRRIHSLLCGRVQRAESPSLKIPAETLHDHWVECKLSGDRNV
jgi:hypothetical protein